MKYTKNYNLKKPEVTDSYNVDDFNENADAIDAALAMKAPAGYGLGTMCKSISSVTDITENGWWVTNGDTPDGNWWLCLSFTANASDDVVIYAWNLSGTCSAKRSKSSTGWGPWEWIDPPMALNTEYRTTEKYNYKPVYCKLVKFGAFPNAATKNFDHGISNIALVTEWHATNTSSGTNIEKATAVKSIVVSKTQISVTTEGDGSGWDVQFLLKYTKTTD